MIEAEEKNINIDIHYSSTLIRIYPHITPHQQYFGILLLRPRRKQQTKKYS